MIRVTRNPDDIKWQAAADLVERAPLGSRDPKKLRRAFEASYALSFAWKDGELVGLARAISDGEYQAAVYDVVVDPDAQGRGVGRALMDDLHDQLSGVANIILYTAPGKEPFYRRLGYRRLKTGMAVLAPPNSGTIDQYLASD